MINLWCGSPDGMSYPNDVDMVTATLSLKIFEQLSGEAYMYFVPFALVFEIVWVVKKLIDHEANFVCMGSLVK